MSYKNIEEKRRKDRERYHRMPREYRRKEHRKQYLKWKKKHGIKPKPRKKLTEEERKKRKKETEEKQRIKTKKRRLKLRFQIFQRDTFTCQYCGRKAPEAILEIDHRFPKSKGGKNDINNYITACKECNYGKGDSILEEFKVQQRGLAHPLL